MQLEGNIYLDKNLVKLFLLANGFLKKGDKTPLPRPLPIPLPPPRPPNRPPLPPPHPPLVVNEMMK